MSATLIASLLKSRTARSAAALMLAIGAASAQSLDGPALSFADSTLRFQAPPMSQTLNLYVRNAAAIDQPFSIATADGYYVASGLWHATFDRDSHGRGSSWHFGRDADSNGDQAGTSGSIVTFPMPVYANIASVSFWSSRAADSAASGDVCSMQVSSDGGATWRTMVTVTDTDGVWHEYTADVAALVGHDILVRFQVDRDAARGGDQPVTDGWYVDDLRVSNFDWMYGSWVSISSATRQAPAESKIAVDATSYADGLPPGMWRATIRANRDAVPPASCQATLAIEGQVVDGVVVSARDGQPIPHATISYSGPLAANIFSNESGGFRINGIAGVYHIRATSGNGAVVEQDFTLPSTSAQLRLVIDGYTGGPDLDRSRLPTAIKLTGRYGVRAQTTMTIANRGDQPLVYWATSRGGFDVHGDHSPIAAGEERTVTVFATTTSGPRDETGTITIHTNDPTDGEVTIPISVHIDGPIWPNAVLATSRVRGTTPLEVEFDASQSTDDGMIASSHLDFGDGESTDVLPATHVYANDGTYWATLTVTDDSGLQSSDRGVIEVRPPNGDGLTGEYFPNADLAGKPALTRDEAVDFDWRTDAPDASLPADGFSVRWTGEIESPISGALTLSTISDDGIRVWIDDKLMLEHWDDHAAVFDSATAPITVRAGDRHRIRIEYYENKGEAVAKLLWTGPGLPMSPVPRERLYSIGGWSPPTIEYSIDNASTEIWVDGSSMKRGVHDKDWTVSDVLTLNSNPQVIAIRAVNWEPGGFWAGLIARITLSDGSVVTSDGTWRVFTGGEPPADGAGRTWHDAWYDDANWTRATVAGAYGVQPWFEQPGLMRLNGSSWIWAGDAFKGISPVYFRCHVGSHGFASR